MENARPEIKSYCRITLAKIINAADVFSMLYLLSDKKYPVNIPTGKFKIDELQNGGRNIRAATKKSIEVKQIIAIL